jgi:MtN3 and saliva related transmembrane protein
MSNEESTELEIVTDLVGYTAGFCAAIITIPQIYRIIKTKKANDVALWTIILLLITSALFITYGVLISSLPLIITDIVAFILDGVLLISKLYFDYKTKREEENVERNPELESDV